MPVDWMIWFHPDIYEFMLTLESRCIPLVLAGVLILRTLPNCKVIKRQVSTSTVRKKMWWLVGLLHQCAPEKDTRLPFRCRLRWRHESKWAHSTLLSNMFQLTYNMCKFMIKNIMQISEMHWEKERLGDWRIIYICWEYIIIQLG